MSDDQNGVVTLKVRVTPEFREKIVETAKNNNRSMNAEIVHRLEQSFNDESLFLSTESISPSENLNVQPTHNVANNPIERQKLARLAAQQALQSISAQDLVEIVFHKLNQEGSRLTVEEVKGIKKAP